MKTWHAEQAVAATILVAVTLATGGSWLELVGTAAVMLSLGHASVADRLAEAEHERRARQRVFDAAVGFPMHDADRLAVTCHHWATRYLVGKEALWVVYFVVHHSWAALAGCAIFLAYPVWRRWWRSRHPLGRREARG